METLKILNPYSKVPSIESFDAKKEFKKMTLLHKTVTAIAVAVLSVFTLGFATSSYFHTLVGRFRSVELKASQIPKIADIVTPDNKKPETSLEPAVVIFWKTYYATPELQRALQGAAINGEEPQKAANNFVDRYMQLKKSSEPKFVLSLAERKTIVDAVYTQLAENTHAHTPTLPKTPTEPGLSSTKSLPGNQTLKVYNTVGDGSCGVHALLGKKDASGQYACDAAAKRKEFCDHLRQVHKIGFIPERIENMLSIYFRDFDNEVPDDLKPSLRDIHSRYHSLYTGIHYENLKADERRQSLELRDSVLEQFLNDNEVFETYLTHLEKVGTYLHQAELIAMAEFFDKKLVLYQPQWGNQDNRVSSDTFNESGKETAVVWYNGLNHYEKAVLS